MADNVGIRLKFGFKKTETGVAWGTESATALGANDGFGLTTEDVRRDQATLVDDDLGTDVHPKNAENLDISVEGGLALKLRYSESLRFLPFIMGTTTSVSYKGAEDFTETGTIGGTTTTLTDSGQSWTVDALIGKWIVLDAGTNAYQSRQITDNDATSVTVATWLAPSTDTEYYISDYAPRDLGVADASTSTTLEDATKSWTADAYNGLWVQITGGTGSGQIREISDTTTTTITVKAAWTTTPDVTSTYEVFGYAASHQYDLADNVEGLYGTYVNKNDNYVFTTPSLKLGGFTVSGSMGEYMSLAIDAIGSDQIVNSAINTTGTAANITRRDSKNAIVFNHLQFRVNNASGGALSSSDNLSPNNIELVYSRNMDSEVELTNTGNIVSEPLETDTPTSTLKATFPRNSTSTDFTDWAANTEKKIQLIFTSTSTIASTNSVNRSFTFSFPHARHNLANLETTKGALPLNVEFMLLGAETAPTGMSGITEPISLTAVTDFGGDILQDGN